MHLPKQKHTQYKQLSLSSRARAPPQVWASLCPEDIQLSCSKLLLSLEPFTFYSDVGRLVLSINMLLCDIIFCGVSIRNILSQSEKSLVFSFLLLLFALTCVVHLGFNLIYGICCSVAQSCPTLCDPMDCGTPGFPVLHHLPEFAQAQVHWVSDAIQSSRPLLSPPPPALNLSQHQDLFQWLGSLHQVAKVMLLGEYISCLPVLNK